MIKKIRINDVACFGPTPEELDELRKVNFIYGANATGKTTISRIIADADADGHSDCELTWQHGLPIETFVYNRDFVDRNLNHPDQLRGIFTLGEKDKKAEESLADAREGLRVIDSDIANLETTLNGDEANSGKIEDLKRLEDEFEDHCWTLKQDHDAEFRDAFKGYRGSKRDFKEKLLLESADNSADLVAIETLRENAQMVFGENPREQETLSVPNCSRLLEHEVNPILKKTVIGKSDVDIARLIRKLGNSDWVKQGREYYDAMDRVCPFCQQKTDDSLETSLNEYFDEAFDADSDAIDVLNAEYKFDSDNLKRELQVILDNPPEGFDSEGLQNQLDVCDAKIGANLRRIDEKQREPSKSIALNSLCGDLATVVDLLKATNTKILEHNKMVENAQTERIKLRNQVWRYLLDCEIKKQLNDYNARKHSLETQITGLKKKIALKNRERSTKVREIIELEKETTTIQPTINDINSILRSFGFESFYLAKSNRERFYEIRRSDGSSAKETLSEGERSFISFLYFYHLLKGSTRESGLKSDRIVVFDDPVSSLDSNVLFIVSTLIKGIFSDLRDNFGPIKQVFVLTHNAYFHKEVTYSRRRRGGRRLSHETFWTVRKSGSHSTIESHKTNPIKSSYESLWMEAKRTDTKGLFLQNTLRRILEHYFKILGNLDFDDICAGFDGVEKLVCQSLFSWVHEGSHSVYDDAHYSPDGTEDESYLTVFKDIFYHTGNRAHYEMMMGDDHIN